MMPPAHPPFIRVNHTTVPPWAMMLHLHAERMGLRPTATKRVIGVPVPHDLTICFPILHGTTTAWITYRRPVTP